MYRGQCAELCGKDHAFMPIVVEVVTGEQFDNWIASGGTSMQAASGLAADSVEEQAQTPVVEQAPVIEEAAVSVIEVVAPTAVAAPAAKTWTKEELMSKGEEVSSRCIACHGVDGKGIPGVFPAIAGSAVASGPSDAHIDIVMFGKAGTAMVAFANQLSDEELAAVVTYQRNSYGNDVGDVVLPADIKAKRN